MPPRLVAGIEEESVWKQLRTVYDPEIPVNIVELGLVYDLGITPQDEGNFVKLKMMTFTIHKDAVEETLKKFNK